MELNLAYYDKFILAFSGGKDSIASLLLLLDMGVDRSKIELWHHNVDGGHDEDTFMDWEVTPAYCKSFAAAFGVPIYFSWKEGGFKRELLRENSKTAPSVFEDENHILRKVGGSNGKLSTRRKFPQVSPDLSVRWCSSYLKVDIYSASIINQKRFDNSKTLVVSGERGQESPARAKYKIFEVDRADNRRGTPYVLTLNRTSSKGKGYVIERLVEPGKQDRHIDHWRPLRDKNEAWVWDIIRRYKVRLHPAYYLGFSRLSCRFCIFGDEDQLASANQIAPQIGEEIMELEDAFGVTIKRNISLRNLIKKGVPYQELQNKELLELSRSKCYTLPIIMEEPWVLPAGAFGKSCGPV